MAPLPEPRSVVSAQAIADGPPDDHLGDHVGRRPLAGLQPRPGGLDALDAPPVPVVEEAPPQSLDGGAVGRGQIDRGAGDIQVGAKTPAAARPGAPLGAAQDHERLSGLSAGHLHHCGTSAISRPNLSEDSTSGGVPGTDRGTDEGGLGGTGSSVASRGVRAAVSAPTQDARADRSAPDAAVSVDPVVTTSSTTITPNGAAPCGMKHGPRRRSARDRPVCGVPGERSSNRRHGLSQRRASAVARSSAWSKPRCRRRRRLVGAQVTTTSAGGSTSAAIPSASQASAARSLRYFTLVTSVRAAPSYASNDPQGADPAAPHTGQRVGSRVARTMPGTVSTTTDIQRRARPPTRSVWGQTPGVLRSACVADPTAAIPCRTSARVAPWHTQITAKVTSTASGAPRHDSVSAMRSAAPCGSVTGSQLFNPATRPSTTPTAHKACVATSTGPRQRPSPRPVR